MYQNKQKIFIGKLQFYKYIFENKVLLKFFLKLLGLQNKKKLYKINTFSYSFRHKKGIVLKTNLSIRNSFALNHLNESLGFKERKGVYLLFFHFSLQDSNLCVI